MSHIIEHLQLETKIAVAMFVSRFHIALDPQKMPLKSVAEFANQY
jgi:hypothetical protein